MVLRVRNLMSTPAVTLGRDENLSLAEEVMRLGRLRHLPVVDGDNRLVGLVTHRDLLRVQTSSLAELSSSEDKQLKRAVRAGEVMQRDVRSIAADALALEAATIMRDQKIGCLPVVDGGSLVGIITEADFLDLAIKLLSPDGEPVTRTHAPGG